MAVYSYTAKGVDGKTRKGQLAAASEASLTEQLRQQGLTLTASTTQEASKTGLSSWLERIQGVPVVQKIFFTQNLGVMLRGGFSISRAMGTLALQVTHRYFRRVILELQSDLEGGTSFAQALKKHPRVFSELFVNMVSAGELGGKLDEVLKSLTLQMKKDHQLISKVKGAMTYPIVVIFAMIGAGIAMIVFVIPKLMTIFTESNTQLPLPTRILIGISNLLQHQGIWIGLGLIGVVIFIVWFSRTPRGQRWFDSLLLVTPIAGPIIRKINLARFTRTLSSMLATDIPIIQTFQVIAKTLGSYHYRQSVIDASEALRTGAAIAKVLERYPKLYPPLIQQMVSVGEESGTLDEVAGELADFLEEEVDQTMSNLSTIIEPVLLLVLGVGVAGMAVAILLPIYSLSNAIS
ncbi:MAG: type II secretion system F family protein [Candidatus Kerfeldbacteria bacterium]|nr:type II secretion system F family protein [Candidatus Kerfeldbacteria bacterium]